MDETFEWPYFNWDLLHLFYFILFYFNTIWFGTSSVKFWSLLVVRPLADELLLHDLYIVLKKKIIISDNYMNSSKVL